MLIKEVTFLKSAADKSGFLVTNKPIICVAGRSNVGKSSFINMLANRKKLAKTSDTPGRTRLVNYFDFGEFILADLPGYGYARVSRSEKLKWAKTLDDFFNLTKICHAFSLVDIRHEPTNDDKDMIKYLYDRIIPFTVLTTKADKLSRSKVNSNLKTVANSLSLGVSDIIATDYKGYGRDRVLSKIEEAIKVYYGLNSDSDAADSSTDSLKEG
ncbi:MAG: ribosome biogenesis GTP-binding protein YihA/YsxC [Christensenellaceae bacterium]